MAKQLKKQHLARFFVIPLVPATYSKHSPVKSDFNLRPAMDLFQVERQSLWLVSILLGSWVPGWLTWRTPQARYCLWIPCACEILSVYCHILGRFPISLKAFSISSGETACDSLLFCDVRRNWYHKVDGLLHRRSLRVTQSLEVMRCTQS